MSKIIKSEHCVEAHPCRLDPVDVDAFFVNNPEEEESLDSQQENEREAAATLEEILETIFPPGETQGEEPEENIETTPANPEEENTAAGKGIEPDNAHLEEPAPAPPEIDLFKINLEAEKMIDQSKQEAGIVAKLAREKADNITGTARDEAVGIVDRANGEAAKITENAQAQADEIIGKAKAEADETLNNAKQEAENTITEGKRQAEELKTEAHQQGLAAGHQEGLAKAKQEIEQNLTNSINLLAEAEGERVNRIISSEAELLKLVSGIAEKIIGSELKSHPEQVVSVVREALARAATANSITVKINPEDQQMIQENLPSLQEVFGEPKAIAVKGDPTISPGECFIETEHGKVDARIKSQLERVMNEILKVGQVNEPD